DARPGGRRDEPHDPQQQELAVARRRLAQALDGLLEIVGAPLGERDRRIGHPAQLHPLLRPRGGERLAEVVARLLGVVLLGRARAQQAPSLGAPQQTETAPQPVTTAASSGGGGLKTWQEILIFGAGVVLLAGIAIAIISDARERAPAPEGELATVGPHRHRRE